MKILSPKYNFFLTLLAKGILVVAALYTLWWQLTTSPGQLKFTELLHFLHPLSNFPLLILVGALTFVNWAFEALKWQRLLRPLYQLSFGHSFWAIWGGMAATIWVPNRLGEHFGRLWFLPRERKHAFPLTMVGGVSQMVVTLLMGVIGIIYCLMTFVTVPPWAEVVFFLLAFSGVVGVGLCYYNVGAVAQKLTKYPLLSRLHPYIKGVKQLRSSDLSVVLGFSLLRYAVFSIQFLILLYIFDVPVRLIETGVLIGAIFALQTIIPAPALSELGVRGNVAVFILGYSLMVPAKVGILAATLSLWLFNVGMPTIMGILPMMRNKSIQTV